MQHTNFTKEQIKKIAIDNGAVDCGIISVSELPDDQQINAAKILPSVRSVISIAITYNQSAIKSQFQPVSNMEYRHAYKRRDQISYGTEVKLSNSGAESVVVTETFPLDSDLKTPWLISHKDIAVKAGIGVMGLNRLVLHKTHGSSLLLASILTDIELSEYDTPSDYDPCINCNLCKTVCPTKSINENGFKMMSCYTHNYRNRGNSFHDLLTRQNGDSKDLSKISYDDKNKLWTSIQEGYGYSCNQCVAVCPASKTELAKFRQDKNDYYKSFVKPFIDKEETIYVLKNNTDMEKIKNNPAKNVKLVSNGMSIDTIPAFKNGLSVIFDKTAAQSLKRDFKFVFTGSNDIAFTVRVDQGTMEILNKTNNEADVTVFAEDSTWLHFINTGKGMLKSLATGKIKIKGNPKYLKDFSKVFAN